MKKRLALVLAGVLSLAGCDSFDSFYESVIARGDLGKTNGRIPQVSEERYQRVFVKGEEDRKYRLLCIDDALLAFADAQAERLMGDYVGVYGTKEIAPRVVRLWEKKRLVKQDLQESRRFYEVARDNWGLNLLQEQEKILKETLLAELAKDRAKYPWLYRSPTSQPFSSQTPSNQTFQDKFKTFNRF